MHQDRVRWPVLAALLAIALVAAWWAFRVPAEPRVTVRPAMALQPARQAPVPSAPAPPTPPAPRVAPDAPSEAPEEPPPEREAAALVRIHGVVEGDFQGASVWVRACGRRVGIPSHDRTFEIRMPAQPCDVRAWRVQGLLERPGPAVAVDPVPGDDIEVVLRLPRGGSAGFGFRFQPREDGVLVLQVHPDTPAHDAGLRSGDLILTMDGVDVAGMSQEDFLATSLGHEGTLGRMEIEGPDGTLEQLEMRRELIPASAEVR